ncbi:kinase-like domain-containing protein, partial [Mycena floridula]
LAARGYQLRPRYHRRWKPSWRAGGALEGKAWVRCEDSLDLDSLYWGALDAIRKEDGEKVVLKIVFDDTDELDIAQSFSESPLRDDPRNHCIRVLDILHFPKRCFKIIVFPFLIPCNPLPTKSVPKAIDFFRQTLQAKFMHDHNVAHGDVSSLNIMMDCGNDAPLQYHFSSENMYPLESGLLVPRRIRWRRRHVRYLFIDFGLSRHYPEGKELARTTEKAGQVKVTPEMSKDAPYNPFEADIVQLGSAFQEMLPLRLAKHSGLDVLLNRMTAMNPEDRPTATEALSCLEEIVASMWRRRLKALFRISLFHRTP